MVKRLTAGGIAADFGGTSREWVKLAAAGAVPGVVRRGGRGPWLFDVSVFEAWLAAGRPPIAGPLAAAAAEADAASSARERAALKRRARSQAIDAGIASLVREALGKR